MTEDLAGVGLSVEMVSHDIMLLMSRAQDIGKQLARGAVRMSSSNGIQEQADMLVGVLQHSSLRTGCGMCRVCSDRRDDERSSESSRCWTRSIIFTKFCLRRGVSTIGGSRWAFRR